MKVRQGLVELYTTNTAASSVCGGRTFVRSSRESPASSR